MENFDPKELKNLYLPSSESHKGQNGKLLIIAGSGLFHAPAIWSAQIASRIVDMVFIASTPENNRILTKIKEKFHNGIVISREDINNYADEADCILIGPGLPRPEGQKEGDNDTKQLTKRILTEFKEKQFVIDGGALQMMELKWIPKQAILTPHGGEWGILSEKFRTSSGNGNEASIDKGSRAIIKEFTRQNKCMVLLKGQKDIVCSPDQCLIIKGGNTGMTKGGTGDVLAGLVAALACKNKPFLAACAGSYINKKAGDALFEKTGYYYNATDLLNEIPKIMKKSLINFP